MTLETRGVVRAWACGSGVWSENFHFWGTLQFVGNCHGWSSDMWQLWKESERWPKKSSRYCCCYVQLRWKFEIWHQYMKKCELLARTRNFKTLLDEFDQYKQSMYRIINQKWWAHPRLWCLDTMYHISRKRPHLRPHLVLLVDWRTNGNSEEVEISQVSIEIA